MGLLPRISRRYTGIVNRPVVVEWVGDANDNLEKARKKVRKYYGAISGDDIVDLLVGVDDTC